jgi:hypothetical protein
LPDAARNLLGDTIGAGSAAAILSGLPSTAYALARGRDPLEATLAAGALLLPDERRPGRLLLAAVPAHLAISLGWAALLAATLPRHRTTLAGAAAGLAIAAIDLGVLARSHPRVRALPLGPQLADHAAYGAIVGAVVARRRARRDNSA